ncbi:MAG: hypothetical protein RIK87_10915 [Fuerstiella sp.]
MLPRYRLLLIFILLPLVLIADSHRASAQNVRPTTITRVFWQDREAGKLSYADLVTTNKWNLKRGWVQNFPTLTAEQHSLSQMQHVDGMLMLAVRGTDDENLQSGWVAIDTGVFEEPHGNHFHWKYTRKPTVKRAVLDAEQGNPTHVTVDDNTFYLGHDAKNGFTQVTLPQLKTSGSADGVRFFSGGGGHISLAVVDNAVAYATWIDREGENAGRVDVISLEAGGSGEPAYSFRLPSGGIHGATTNSGKVFFAAADGVYWVQADTSVSETAETVQVNHISLGIDEETQTPFRTNAFANDRNWVVCTTGSGPTSALCLLNAASTSPAVIRLPVSAAEGLRLTAPELVLSLGKRYAFVFQDRIEATSDVQEQLTVIELDPNRDRNFSDARVRTTMPVGASRVEGHHGNHHICFDAYGRHAVFTEPGEGILNVMTLNNLRIVARFRVGGAPDSIVAVGAPEHFH